MSNTHCTFAMVHDLKVLILHICKYSIKALKLPLLLAIQALLSLHFCVLFKMYILFLKLNLLL